MRSSSSDNSGCIGIIAMVVLAIVAVGGIFTISLTVDTVAYSTQETHTVRVCGKESVPRGKSGNQYRVYTKDARGESHTFVVEDYTTWGGHKRWNSADDYGRIKIGEVMTVKTYGWRIGLFSAFPNILTFEQVMESTIPLC